MDRALELSAICEAICADKKVFGAVDYVTTDSRDIRPGCLFVALAGERFDGHNYIGAALEQGAAYAVAQCHGGWPEERVLLTGSTERALRRIAALYRAQLSTRIVAVTGSVGKTTTRDMTAAVLGAKYRTTKTQGNLNNQIGLPKTLLCVESDHEAAVLEMGMSGFGEIEELSLCASPDVAVITNIGVSHMELLGSRAGIFRAKTEIVRGLKPGAPLILNGDDDMLCTFEGAGHPVLLFGIHNPACAVRAKDIRAQDGGTRFTIVWQGADYPAFIPALGEHNVKNALAGFAAGMALGLEPERAVAGLAAYEATGMRQRMRQLCGMTVVEDCYNASPDSFCAALRTLAEQPCTGRRVLVAADMLELGELSEQAHREVGELAGALHVDAVFTYGEHGRLIAQGAHAGGVGEAHWFPGQAQLAGAVAAFVKPGDIVWFKASRGMKLEESVQALYAAHGQPYEA